MLLPSLTQCVNGSPIYWRGQLQIGLWLMTWQSAFKPHNPGHGSLHFWLIQARWGGHSVLTRHSGRQCGGVPW